ncbi:MAG: tetratricopeptide repeat protein [Bacteroidales bacterium]|nr:MAG: tetratricopeptide repeat protein [Bacteroidales bacterium]
MNPDPGSFLEEEEYSDIINRYKDMLKKNKSCFFDIYEFENIIDYYILNSDYKAALKSVRTGLDQHPYSISLKLKHAQILIEDKKPQVALKILNDIEIVDSYNFEIHLLKGKALNSLKRLKEATDAFDQAISLSQEDKDDVIYEIALSFIELDRIKTAIKYLILAFEINDSNLLVLYELAICYERLNNIEKSIYYLEKYLDVDPYSENIWFNLGLLYSSVKKYDDAIKAYDYAIAICPEFTSAYTSKADTHICNNNYYNAIEVYRELLEIDNKNVRLFCNIGGCYEKLGDYKSAIENYDKATKIENDHSDAWYKIGASWFHLMKYHKSIFYLKKAIKIKPDISEYWFLLGDAYAKIKHFNKAVKAYTNTIELDPDNYEAWIAYAKVYYDNNKITSAIRILEESYQYNHNIAIINYQLAAYYIYNKQPSLSYKYFEKGLLLNYKEHNKVLINFPETRENDQIKRLILKYKNLK